MAKKEERMKKVLEEERAAREFHANPVPKGLSSEWLKSVRPNKKLLEERSSVSNPDSGGQKWPTKIEDKFRSFMFWSAGSSLLKTEGFFCSLDVLYGGLGICKLLFLIQIKIEFFFSCNFFQFLVIKTLDPDWIRIRIGIQPKMLDPDAYQTNTDPQPWL